MNDLFDKEHVKNHKWFKNLKADSAAKEKRIRKHAQSIDLGDSTGKPNLSDMFSSANRLGLLNNSKKLPDLIKTAILTAREVIDQFDFPISPAISYLGVKNVKTAGTTDDVLSGTIVLMCKFATVGGLKQSFDVPIQVVAGKVLPPSVIKFNGRDIVLAQSSVNAMVQRASSYELIPVRKQFSAPLTRDERESATELRNEIGYQAREGIGPVSTIRRTYKKAQEDSAPEALANMLNAVVILRGCVSNEGVELRDSSGKTAPVFVAVVHDGSGYTPGAAVATSQRSSQGALEEAYEILEDHLFSGNGYLNEQDIEEARTTEDTEGYNPITERFDGAVFNVSPQDFQKIVGGTKAINGEELKVIEFYDYFEEEEPEDGPAFEKDSESDLTDKITPNEPMADMDDAKKFQNEPLRAKKAKNTLGFEFTSEEDAQEFFDSLEGTEFEGINVHFMNVGDTINAYVDQKVLSNPEELQKLYHRFYDELGRRDTSGEDSDIDLNHFAKKAQEDDESLLRDVDIDGYRLQMWDNGERYERGQRRNYIRYSFTDPQGNVVFSGDDYSPSPMHAIDSDESVRGLLGYLTLKPGDTDDEYFEKYTDEQKSFADSAAEGLSMWGMDPQDDDEDDFYHTFKDWSGGHQASRVASMGTAIPGGYEKVKSLMDKAQDEGKDTFPRSWIHVLRNYILEVVSTASQDAWATHLVNDGYVLNPYGSNNRGREKTAQMDEDWVEESEKEESDRWKDVSKNIDAEFKYLAEQLGDRGLSGLQRQYDELYPEGILGGLDTPSFKEFVVAKYKNKSAQVEDEWNDELTMDEPDSHIYDGTKTPMEPGDSVKFQGHDGAIRGTVVEVNKAAGNAIVKAKGYEYRVALEDIQPLNSTFKKMYANSCLRILPPEPKYAQIFNNMEKNPSIDNPWAATWDARDKDLHSGPPEIKNKDVKPILKGIGKKSQASSRSWEKSDAGDNARGRDHFAHPKRITINISHLAAGDWEDQEEQFLTYWRDAIDGFIFVDPGMEIPGWPEETSVLIKITESDDSIKLFGFEAEEEMSLKAELEGTVEAAWEWASRTFGN